MTRENVLYLHKTGTIERTIERPGRRLEPPPGVADWIGVDVVSIACDWCGEEVVQKPKGYLAHYCSPLCRGRAYSAKKSPECIARERQRARERRRRLAEPVRSLPDEFWLAIPGYEGLYEVSSLSRVKSLRRYAHHVSETRGDWKALRQERLLTPTLSPLGYYRLALTNSNKVKGYWGVHQLVCLAFHGPKPSPEHMVRHLNGDSLDNRPANVVWGTSTENNRDTVLHGTHVNTRKTECLRGHEFTPENTYIVKRTGSRYCRVCKNAANSRYAYRKRKEAA